VVGHDEDAGSGQAQLERVARLYKDGQFHKVIVSAANSGAGPDEQSTMTKYLEDHGVASSAIIDDTDARSTAEVARDVAEIMKSKELDSVMIVAEYYRMSRLKLALLHSGVRDIKKSHVGEARVNDAVPVAREVLALYTYVWRTFLMPAAEKIKKEATTEADKAKVEAEKAKENVDKKLDTLPK
jgi:vancomycin permeability regulator SanA